MTLMRYLHHLITGVISMPNDQEMETAQLKKVIERLKQTKTIEEIANSEKAPESADAARTLIERLKQPRKPQLDISPLYALASPNVGQKLMQAQQQRNKSLQDKEMEKLALISKLTVGNTGNPEQDMKALEKVGSMASGSSRGATNMSKSWDNIAKIDKLKSMAEDFASGKLTFDAQSNMEYSSAISGLITNRAPGIEVVRETAYRYFGGDVNAMIQYITGKPHDALSKKKKEFTRQRVGQKSLDCSQ